VFRWPKYANAAPNAAAGSYSPTAATNDRAPGSDPTSANGANGNCCKGEKEEEY
jgi:hypothetical protein